MRTRTFGSLLVVVIALIPTLFGGPIFACAMIALGVAGFHEYRNLTTFLTPSARPNLAPMAGYVAVAAFGLAAALGAGSAGLLLATSLAIGAPLVVLLRFSSRSGQFVWWSLTSAGALYLGLPVYAAIALRAMPGDISARWLTEAANALNAGWDAAPRGLAWLLMILLTIWSGDTSAFLTGRSIGTRRLAPLLSPNKTIQGAIGGLLAAVVTGGLAFSGFGLGEWWQGALAGGVIGVAGQIGDLAESFLKRQAGVKDSGASIPGHGGFLDRIDALLFALPVGFILAAGYEGLGR